jgi:hypothetical protein
MDEDYFENKSSDDEVLTLMKDHDLDLDTARDVREIMDEYGVDEFDAIELEECL